MNSYLQKESEWEDTNEKGVGLCNRSEENICTEEEEGIFIVEKRERRGVWVHKKTTEERVH